MDKDGQRVCNVSRCKTKCCGATRGTPRITHALRTHDTVLPFAKNVTTPKVDANVQKCIITSHTNVAANVQWINDRLMAKTNPHVQWGNENKRKCPLHTDMNVPIASQWPNIHINYQIGPRCTRKKGADSRWYSFISVASAYILVFAPLVKELEQMMNGARESTNQTNGHE